MEEYSRRAYALEDTEEMNTNYVDIIGNVLTLPTIISIDKKMCSEFLLSVRSCITPYGEQYYGFSIAVLLDRTNAIRMINLGAKIVGKKIRIHGQLSLTTIDMKRKYTGFYIYAEKLWVPWNV